MDFNFHISRSRTSLEAYFNSSFCLSQSRTSLEASIDFKFYRSQSTTTLEAHVDLDFHNSMLRTSLDVYIDDLQATKFNIAAMARLSVRLLWSMTGYDNEVVVMGNSHRLLCDSKIIIIVSDSLNSGSQHWFNGGVAVNMEGPATNCGRLHMIKSGQKDAPQKSDPRESDRQE